jgi:hypothetical protein
LFHEESFHIFITSDHHETEEKTERGEHEVSAGRRKEDLQRFLRFEATTL